SGQGRFGGGGGRLANAETLWHVGPRSSGRQRYVWGPPLGGGLYHAPRTLAREESMSYRRIVPPNAARPAPSLTSRFCDRRAGNYWQRLGTLPPNAGTARP